jgi:hypothetical protein
MQGGYPAGSQPPDPNLPQPPDPSQQQQGPPQQPMTLGQANEPPGNPFLEQFLQMHQMLDQQAQALKEPLQPPQPGPSLLESLGTFGIANLKHIADENTRREQNYVRHQKNLAIDQHTNDMALKATDAQAAAAGLAGRANLAQQGMALRLMQYQQQLQEYAHKLGRESVQDALPMPKTTQETRLREAQGMEQDPLHPSKMRLRQNPTTGAWEAPAAGSPMATALGGDTGTAAPSSGPKPGESPADYADRRANEQKMALPTTSTRTMSEMAPKVLQLADQVERSMKDIQTGPLKSRAQEFMSGTIGVGNAPFTKYRTDVGLLQTSLMRMHVGARGGQQIMSHFKNLLDSAKQSPENMQAALGEIRDYAKSMLPKDAATSSTPTSTTPPSTGAPTQATGATGVTPSGIRFRVVQ